MKAFVLAAVVAAASLVGRPLHAAEVRVLATNAAAEIMADLAPQFEAQTGHKLAVTSEPTNAIVARIRNGETADAVILIKTAMDELRTSGRIVPDSAADLATTHLAVAVRKGAPKPDIATVESFKAAMLAARSIARSEIGASGVHFGKVLERLGIAEAMRPKLVIAKGGRTADFVARGEAEMAVQMLSELLPVAAVEIVGPLPGDLGFQITITAAVMQGAKEAEAARALVAFLRSEQREAVFRQRGLQRVN